MNNPEFTDAEYREAAALWDVIDRECRSLAALKKYHLEMAGYRITQKKLAAAKRAVSIINKKSLRNWPRLAEHRSRVFRNLNKLRAV